MSRLVVDAAVGLKWVVAEADSRDACALHEHELLAPDSVVLDWGDALAAKVDRGELSEAEAEERFHALLQAPIAMTSTRRLATQAQQIARALSTSMRQATYLALAIDEDAMLVSADRHLVAAVEASTWRGRASLLGTALAAQSPAA